MNFIKCIKHSVRCKLLEFHLVMSQLSKARIIKNETRTIFTVVTLSLHDIPYIQGFINCLLNTVSALPLCTHRLSDKIGSLTPLCTE